MPMCVNVILQNQIILIIRYFINKIEISWFEPRLKHQCIIFWSSRCIKLFWWLVEPFCWVLVHRPALHRVDSKLNSWTLFMLLQKLFDVHNARAQTFDVIPSFRVVWIFCYSVENYWVLAISSFIKTDELLECCVSSSYFNLWGCPSFSTIWLVSFPNLRDFLHSRVRERFHRW